jgi:serine/threonine protein kinase
LILAELLLTKPDPPAPATSRQQSSFPTCPTQSHSPQPIYNLPLLSTHTRTRRYFIEQMVRLFGPLPPSFQAGKFWSDEYTHNTFAQNGTLLSQILETEGVDPDLIDFIMRMLTLDPVKRISARNALRHEWLVGPLLGYWAALGVEWTPLARRDQSWQRPVRVMGDGSVASQLPKLEHPNVLSQQARRRDPSYGFPTTEDDEDDNEEVSLVCMASSPTNSFINETEHVYPLLDVAYNRMTTMKCYYCE